MSTYRILSLDGGGLRGLVTAVLLKRIDDACPGFLSDIDLVVGTSTGGILALALASGLDPEAIARLYEVRGKEIFASSLRRSVASLGKLVGAEYDNANLRAILRETFGQMKLRQLPKKVAVTAFDLTGASGVVTSPARTWSPKIFHNFLGVDSDGECLVADVALRTSAAPTYFSSADGFIDGGVFANNPSVVGLAQALDPRSSGAVRQVDDLVLMSVGTGTNPVNLAGGRHDFGVVQWARPLLEILMDGVSEVADFQCRQILGIRYHRLQPVYDREIGMDDVSKLPLLRTLGEREDIDVTCDWVRKRWLSYGS